MNSIIETDEAYECFASFSSLDEFLKKIPSNIMYWRWAYISMHNAIQGSMVIALRRHDGLGVQTPKLEKEFLLQYEETGVYPRMPNKLMRFCELYKRIKRKGKIQSGGGEPYIPTGDQNRSMKILNERRNEIIHFIPKTWFWDVSYSPTLFLDLMDIPKYLSSNCIQFIWNDELTKEMYTDVFESIESTLVDLTNQYPTRRSSQ